MFHEIVPPADGVAESVVVCPLQSDVPLLLVTVGGEGVLDTLIVITLLFPLMPQPLVSDA